MDAKCTFLPCSPIPENTYDAHTKSGIRETAFGMLSGILKFVAYGLMFDPRVALYPASNSPVTERQATRD